MTTPVANPAKLDITQRVSFLSNVSGAKDGEYENMKTPPAADIEGGALREGGAPNLFSREYIGVVTQYAAVGLIDAVLPATIYPFLQNYLNVEGKTYLTASTLVALPWSFKVFYGILSDCVPIFGYRRRPYMILGWSICIAMLFIMSFMPVGDPFWKYPDDASIDPETHPEDYAEARARANFAAPGKGGKYVFIMMLSAFGYLMSDVCADGVVVELAQREPLAVRGTTQATIYGTRTAFNIVGQLIVGFAFNGHQYGGNFDFSLSFTTLMLILAFCMVPMIFVTWFFIKEEKHEPMLFKPYVAELWRLVQLRAVYQVIFYQFFSNVFSAMSYTPASLVQRYLVHVTPINNTLSGILGNLTFLAGITITGKYGLHWNWRMIIVVTGVGVIALDSITTMITIWDVFRSQWLWLGLPIAIQVPAGISFLISTFVVVELAGEGNEGACYGLLTTVSNLAQPFAASLTKIIDRNWDFSDERIQRDTHDVRMDITWAVLIMYVSSIVSWGFLYFLPPQKEATQKLKREGGSSRVLGAITVFYISFALVWSVMTNIMGIFDSTSCLIIAGGDGC
ncbi:hypothetical protein P43SY_009101 [Pythium insidiosum]|uniref:Folate-Biopterin Transporter (FBT) family n=1 Tax=Pythium insidiosum TaxID=114742 RepID=A0AAD5Q772_PYTIN|nr:hypothetical protein P43SY_009101 [Pythium insidiosum]